MKRSLPSIVIAVFVVAATPDVAACEVSLPTVNDLPKWSTRTPDGFVWVGSPKLSAMIPESGHWIAMGPDHNYRDKWWWWREGYRALEESQPELVITATRLDANAPPVLISDATSGLFTDRDLMLVGMEFPAAGCWEVVGKYHGQELRFIFKVGD